MTSFKFSLSVFSGLVLVLPLAASAMESCKPNYTAQYSACMKTDRVVGYQPVIETRRIVLAACKPNEQLLCENSRQSLDIIAELQGLYPQNQGIRMVQAYSKDAEGKFCGPITKLRVKEDVYCDYEIQVPMMELAADPSCPVENVIEASGCYSSESVAVDVKTISSCLDMRPKTQEEWWIKAACLVDAYSAQNEFRVQNDLPVEIYNKIDVQLKAMRNSIRTPEGVLAFLESRL